MNYLSDNDCKVLIQTNLWQQVRVNLGEDKTLADNAGFRYEEAIPPETLMYFPWGTTSTANGNGNTASNHLKQIFAQEEIWQFGGQESLGRGLLELWTAEGSEKSKSEINQPKSESFEIPQNTINETQTNKPRTPELKKPLQRPNT